MRVLLVTLVVLLAGCVQPEEDVAEATHDPWALGVREVLPGEEVAFTLAGTRAEVVYFWDLGDGTTALGPSVVHTYPGPGRYRTVVQELEGDRVVRAFGGWVVVRQPLGFSGSLSSTSGSEEHAFEVAANATRLVLDVETSAGRGTNAVVTLVDPQGRPVAVHRVGEGHVEIPIELEEPASGEWKLVVEVQEGRLDWSAEGEVRHDAPAHVHEDERT